MADAVAYLEANLEAACEIAEEGEWESDETGLRYYWTMGQGDDVAPPMFSVKRDHPDDVALCPVCTGFVQHSLGPEGHKRSHP